MPFEKSVVEGIKMLLERIKAYRHMCFVLTGYNTTFEDDMYRFIKLKELGIESYIMPYNKTFSTPKHHHFERWVNGRYHTVVKFVEYLPWVKEQNKNNDQIDITKWLKAI